jgi:hypothetical protein
LIKKQSTVSIDQRIIEKETMLEIPDIISDTITNTLETIFIENVKI